MAIGQPESPIAQESIRKAKVAGEAKKAAKEKVKGQEKRHFREAEKKNRSAGAKELDKKETRTHKVVRVLESGLNHTLSPRGARKMEAARYIQWYQTSHGEIPQHNQILLGIKGQDTEYNTHRQSLSKSEAHQERRAAWQEIRTQGRIRQGESVVVDKIAEIKTPAERKQVEDILDAASKTGKLDSDQIDQLHVLLGVTSGESQQVDKGLHSFVERARKDRRIIDGVHKSIEQTIRQKLEEFKEKHPRWAKLAEVGLKIAENYSKYGAVVLIPTALVIAGVTLLAPHVVIPGAVALLLSAGQGGLALSSIISTPKMLLKLVSATRRTAQGSEESVRNGIDYRPEAQGKVAKLLGIKAMENSRARILADRAQTHLRSAQREIFGFTVKDSQGNVHQLVDNQGNIADFNLADDKLDPKIREGLLVLHSRLQAGQRLQEAHKGRFAWKLDGHTDDQMSRVTQQVAEKVQGAVEAGKIPSDQISQMITAREAQLNMQLAHDIRVEKWIIGRRMTANVAMRAGLMSVGFAEAARFVATWHQTGSLIDAAHSFQNPLELFKKVNPFAKVSTSVQSGTQIIEQGMGVSSAPDVQSVSASSHTPDASQQPLTRLDATQAVRQAEAQGNLETAGPSTQSVEGVAGWLGQQWDHLKTLIPQHLPTPKVPDVGPTAQQLLADGQKKITDILNGHGLTSPDHQGAFLSQPAQSPDIQNAMHEASLNAHQPAATPLTSSDSRMGYGGVDIGSDPTLQNAMHASSLDAHGQPINPLNTSDSGQVGTDIPGRNLGTHLPGVLEHGRGMPDNNPLGQATQPGEVSTTEQLTTQHNEQLAQAVQQLRGGGHGPVVPDHGGASEIPANKIPTTDARIDQYQYGTGGAGNHTSATPLTSSDSRMDVTSGQAGVSATGAGGTGYHVQGDIGTLTPHGATADGTSVQMDHLGSTTQIDSSIGGSGHDASQIISTGNGETIIVNGHEYTFTGDLPKNVTLETDGRGDISLWNVADPNHPLLLATGHIDTATGNLDITSPDGKLLDVLPSSGVSAFDPSTLHGHLDTSSLEYNTDTPNQDWQHLFTPAGKVDTNGNWIDPSNHAAWDKGNWAIKLVDGHVDGSLAHGHGLIGIQTPEGRVYVDSGTVLVPNEHIPINLYDSHHNLIGQTYSDDLARYEGLTGGDKGSIANFYQENELFKNTVGTHIDANHPVAGGQGWSTADSQDRDFSNPIHPDFLKAVQAYNAAHPDNPIHLTKGIFADRLLLVNPQDGHVIASMHDFTNAHGSGNTEGYNVSQLFDQNGHLKAGVGLTAKATPVVHPPKGDWYGDLRIPPTGDILKAVAVGVLPGAALAAVRNVVPGVRDRGGRPLTIAGGGVSGATGVGAGVLMYSSIPGAGILAATNIGLYALTNLLLRRFRGTRPAVATPGIVSPAAPPPPGIPPASAAVSPTGIPGVAALGAAGGGPFPPGVPPAAPMSALSGNNARVAAQVGNGLFSRRRSPGVPPPAAVQVANYMGITPATARSPQTDVGEQLFREGVTQAKAAEVGQNVDAWIKAEKQRTGLDPTAAQIAEYTLNQLYDARIEGTLNNENNLKNGELEDVLHALGESATTDQKQNRAKIIDQIKKRKINPTRLYNMLALGKSFPSLLHEELVNDALNGMPTGVDVEAIAKVAQVVDSTTTPGKDAALAALRDKLIEDGATVKEVENLLKGEKTKDPRKYTRNMGKRVRQFRMEKQFDKEDLNQADLDAIDAVLKMGAANKKNLAAGALAAGISVEEMGRLVQEAANIKDEGERGREIAKGLRTPTYRSIVGGLDDKVLSELGTHVGGVSADISTDRDTYVDEVLQGLGTKKYSMDIFKKAVTEAEQKAEDEGVDLGDHPEYLTKALAIPEIVGLLKGANQNLIDNVAANFGNNTPRTPEGLAEAGFKEGFDASDWESLSNAGSTNEALLKLAEIRADKALVYANFTPDQRNELASKFGGGAGLTSGELIRKVTERGVTPIQFVTAVRKTMDNAVSESRLAATADEVMTLLVDDYRKGVLLKKLPTETAVNNAADLLDIKTGTTAEKRQEIEKRLGKVDPNKLWDQLSAGKDVAFIEMNQAVENTIPSGIDLPALGRYAGFTIDDSKSKDHQYQQLTEQLVREKIGKVEEVMAELKESVDKAGGDDVAAAENVGKKIKKQRVLKRLLEAQNKNSKALAGMAEGYGLGNNLNDLPDQVIDSELSISEIEKILKASTGTEAMNATFDARMNHTLDRNLERLTVDVNGSAHALGFTGTYTAESLAKAVIGKLNRPDANLITRMGNELDRAGNESEVEAILKKYMAP